MINKLRRCAVAALICFSFAVTAQAAKEDLLLKFITEYRAPMDSEVKLGVWHGDLDKCKELSEKHGIPMIAIWSHEGCAHCEILEKALMSDAFNNWAKDSGLILCFTCDYDPKGQRRYDRPDGDNRTIGKTDGAYYWFCKRPDMLASYPYVRFYWYVDDKKVVDFAVHGDKVDGQQGISNGTYDKAGQNCINYITSKTGFKPYLDNPKTLSSYLGGLFSLEESEGHRLEAETGTKDVSFELVHAGKAAEVATNNTVALIAPNGSVVQTVTVNWTAGQSSQDVTVDASLVPFTANGQKASLVIKDAAGEGQATNHIFYVDSENSSGNPLWIGERAAAEGGSVPALEYGEWTMDLDVAKAKVAAEDGNAYTLVSIQGSLWCPDCANVDRNFLDVEDAGGVNKFKQWAAQKNVALVTIDVPSFSNAEGDY